MSDELAHHPLGASAADRWLNCPGSVLATVNLPDEDSPYAIEGTAAHSFAEMARQQGKDAAEYIGVKIPVDLVDGSVTFVEVTKEMASHIQGFIDYLSALDGDDYNEARVYVDPYVPGAFGTMDAAKVTWRHAAVVDLKYGAGVEVDAYENPQLMFYALGFYLTHGWLYSIDTFDLTVYQPRRNHVDTWSISLDKLLHWAENVLKPGAVLAMTPGAPFKAGKWCKFCKLRASCVTRAKGIFEMNLDEMDDLDSAIVKDVPPLIVLTPDQKARILARKPDVTSFYKALEADAFNEIRQGRPVGDFKIVAGKTNRSWSVPAADVVAAVEAEMLDPDKLFEEPEIISPAQAEKLFGTALFKPATAKKPAGVFVALIAKSDGKPTLVPGSDRRDPLDLSLVEEMEDLDEAV